MQKNIKEIIELINQKQNFVVVGHVGADGDSIGSVTALTRLLDLKGKKSELILIVILWLPFLF